MAGIPGTYVNAVTMGPHLPTQELYQWNLSWGQELWNGAGAARLLDADPELAEAYGFVPAQAV